MVGPSIPKTFFLVASMIGWLMVGAILMYLFPAIADQIVSSDLTHLWIRNLSRSGYNPLLGWVGVIIALAITVPLNIIWLRRPRN